MLQLFVRLGMAAVLLSTPAWTDTLVEFAPATDAVAAGFTSTSVFRLDIAHEQPAVPHAMTDSALLFEMPRAWSQPDASLGDLDDLPLGSLRSPIAASPATNSSVTVRGGLLPPASGITDAAASEIHATTGTEPDAAPSVALATIPEPAVLFTLSAVLLALIIRRVYH
jgi:hypothetical protein